MNAPCSVTSHRESPVCGVAPSLAVNGELAGGINIRCLADLEGAGIDERAAAHVESAAAVAGPANRNAIKTNISHIKWDIFLMRYDTP